MSFSRQVVPLAMLLLTATCLLRAAEEKKAKPKPFQATGKRINPSVSLKDKGRKIYFTSVAARKVFAVAPKTYEARLPKSLPKTK